MGRFSSYAYMNILYEIKKKYLKTYLRYYQEDQEDHDHQGSQQHPVKWLYIFEFQNWSRMNNKPLKINIKDKKCDLHSTLESFMVWFFPFRIYI